MNTKSVYLAEVDDDWPTADVFTVLWGVNFVREPHLAHPASGVGTIPSLYC